MHGRRRIKSLFRATKKALIPTNAKENAEFQTTVSPAVNSSETNDNCPPVKLPCVSQLKTKLLVRA